MEKYNKLLRNITELIEKGLFTSKDLKKDVEDSLKLKKKEIYKGREILTLSPLKGLFSKEIFPPCE